MDFRIYGTVRGSLQHFKPKVGDVVILNGLEGIDKAKQKGQTYLNVEIIAKLTLQTNKLYQQHKLEKEKANQLAIQKVINTELATKQRIQSRCKKIKEELRITACHPRRIERIIDLGGFEALDNFMGE